MDVRQVWLLAVWAAVSLLGLNARLAAAQQPEVAVPMLHAYTNLVEIPVLVLSGNRLRASPLALRDFRISIDSGRLFEPRHVRQEDQDPIHLVLLVDLSPETRTSIAGLGEALPDWSRSLTAKDTVSIALLQGCSLVQTEKVPGVLPSLQRLAAFVSTEVRAATTTDGSSVEPCPGGLRLRDASLVAMEKLTTSNARRVLLLMTDGLPDHSSTSLQQLWFKAGAAGVSIFALRAQTAEAARGNKVVIHRDAFAFAPPRERDGSADALVTLTEWTGGLTLETRGHPLGEALTRIMRLLRERYIVDFVRPSTLRAGPHPVEVHLRDGRLLVTSAGVGLPLIDPRITNDPTTVPSDVSREPPVGTRRMLPR